MQVQCSGWSSNAKSSQNRLNKLLKQKTLKQEVSVFEKTYATKQNKKDGYRQQNVRQFLQSA